MNDEVTYEWNQISTLSYDFTYSHNGTPLCFVYDNKINVFIPGTEDYSVRQCQWDGTAWTYLTTDNYNLSQALYGTVVVFNNKAYLFSDYIYTWDGTEWSFSGKGPDPSCIRGYILVVYNNELHVIGGGNGYIYGSSVHYKWDGSSVDDFGEIVWQQLDNLPINVSSDTYSAVVYDNEIHLIGGTPNQMPAEIDDPVEFTSNHYKYNAEDGWEQVNDQSSIYNAAGMGLVVYDNTLHLLGGFNNGEDILTHYKWNGSAWEADESLPFPAYNGSILIYNDTINIIGSPDSQSANKHYALSIVENVEPVDPDPSGYDPTITPDPARFKKISENDFEKITPEPNTFYRVFRLADATTNTSYREWFYLGSLRLDNQKLASNAQIRAIINGTYESSDFDEEDNDIEEATDDDIKAILDSLYT